MLLYQKFTSADEIMLQAGFFDLEDRFKKIDEKDKLLELNARVDWEAFRPVLKKLEPKRKNNAGRKRKDAVMMFKGLVLQHLYNLSDEELEYQIRDRHSFSRFLGLQPEESVPDANTFWDYRQSLVDHDLWMCLSRETAEQKTHKLRKARYPIVSKITQPS